MEQVAIITQLVQDMIAMNSTEREMKDFLLNLNSAVRTLTYIVKEEIPLHREWAVEYEANKVEREAKEAKEKEEEKAKWERARAREKVEQNSRRRELYQLKNAKKEQK
jgi:hypothetical protein